MISIVRCTMNIYDVTIFRILTKRIHMGSKSQDQGHRDKRGFQVPVELEYHIFLVVIHMDHFSNKREGIRRETKR